MKLLAIDTANWPLGVAIMEEGKLLGEVNTQVSKNHSIRLMPTVEWLCEQVQIQPKELDGIAVAQGPGSYTGVRIGVTTAKTLAWSLKIPLLGVSSLQIIAQNRASFPGLIVPLVDARRERVYCGKYQSKALADGFIVQGEDRLVGIEDLCHELSSTEGQILFIGEGVRVYREQLEAALKDRAIFAAEVEHPPRASQLAHIAFTQWKESLEKAEDIHSFSPEYLQLAEAEATWQKNNR
ncbi:tRNA (adenosine(37)-N6)-threonylcarbamoyltransferase complex dimerization subunit type 1 TsaB [Bacillus horti]|uniref:tRNA threonylcarbamoyladenosine biosynthesis protein TsaB n=1 Tax=Caldalkalibacillus horti TaxID=77523 RepID=A0ABT9W612_9BACI|nr:tRNA (adenosine(37)-N6)-threonylcarbamoyltransferase complex dimerization subunit type 1 TsaB [Bacillus horti]MDQ0168285.1 tRNA threonylcarbamoyladenosine biosynthesis protein TsaB [Bacillus horti]